MKLQEARLKSQGPKLGYRQVAVTGTDRVSIDQVLEEEKLPQKPKPEKPKIRLVPEKPIDKYLLITKLRENPDSSLDISLKEPDHDQHPVNIVFIGHVDAGKSTICGNILLLTGKIDRRTIESYKQERKGQGPGVLVACLRDGPERGGASKGHHRGGGPCIFRNSFQALHYS